MRKYIEFDTEDVRNILADYCHCNDASEVRMEIHDEEIKVIVDINKNLTIK